MSSAKSSMEYSFSAAGEAVAAQVELDDLEVRGHLVGDESEVLVREPRASDLEQVVLALAVHLVPDAGAVDLRVSHCPSPYV